MRSAPLYASGRPFMLLNRSDEEEELSLRLRPRNFLGYFPVVWIGRDGGPDEVDVPNGIVRFGSAEGLRKMVRQTPFVLEPEYSVGEMRGINKALFEVFREREALTLEIMKGMPTQYPKPRKPIKRVAVYTSRFTTVLQYVARDLCDGFRKAGFYVRFLIEPHPWSRVTSYDLAVLLRDFNPDFVLKLDHIRGECPEVYPTNLPIVTWIMDDFKHLWQKELLAMAQPHDLILCMSGPFTNLALKAGYDPKQVKTCPMAVNDNIFNSDVPYNSNFGCAAAMIGHLPDLNLWRDKNQEVYQHHLRRQKIRTDAVDWALEMGLNVKVYGQRWDVVEGGKYKPLWMGEIDNGPLLAQAYRSAGVVIQATVDSNVHMRLLEAFACGGYVFPLACPDDDFPGGLREILPMVPTFHDRDSFRNGWGPNEDIRRQAQLIVLSRHTYKAKALEIVGWLEELIP